MEITNLKLINIEPLASISPSEQGFHSSPTKGRKKAGLRTVKWHQTLLKK